MPTKKNWAGEQQEYNESNGEYASGSGQGGAKFDGKKEGSSKKSFSSFKKPKKEKYDPTLPGGIKGDLERAGFDKLEVVDDRTLNFEGPNGKTWTVKENKLLGFDVYDDTGKMVIKDINANQESVATRILQREQSPEKINVSDFDVKEKSDRPIERADGTVEYLGAVYPDKESFIDSTSEDMRKYFKKPKDDGKEVPWDKKEQKPEAPKSAEDKYSAYKEKGKATWNQKLSKGDKVVIKDRNGNDMEAYIGGFYENQKLQDEDTYEEGKDNLWHDFRGVQLVDKEGKEVGNINANQITKHEKAASEKPYVPQTSVEKKVHQYVEENWGSIQDIPLGMIATDIPVRAPYPVILEALHKSIKSKTKK